MTKRAQKLMNETYGNNHQPAIVALVEFAAQNSGIEPRNYFDPADLHVGRRNVYYDGVKSYRQEVRSIGDDWTRFKAALALCAIEGVTDKEVIEAAPNAFSGRLTWISKDYLREKHGMNTDYTPRWDYCTGQYFPTEYRKAAATVLESALRAIRQGRPPEQRRVTSISELKALNEKNGGCWFEKGAMRFFRTRIESGIIRGNYFVSSEQNGDTGSRMFTLRSFDDQGGVDTVGEFQAHNSKAAAIAAIPSKAEAQSVAA